MFSAFNSYFKNVYLAQNSYFYISVLGVWVDHLEITDKGKSMIKDAAVIGLQIYSTHKLCRSEDEDNFKDCFSQIWKKNINLY